GQAGSLHLHRQRGQQRSPFRQLRFQRRHHSRRRELLDPPRGECLAQRMTTAPRPDPGQVWARTLLTIGVSAVGGGIAAALGIPAGWLIGGAVAVAAAALFGAPMMLPGWLRDGAFVLTGVAMGASV